jgi:acyl carrier protein
MFDWFKDWLDREAGVALESVDLSSSLVHAHKGDSFGLVELLMEVEHEFGVTIPDDPGIQFDTLEDAIRCIRLTTLPEHKQVTRRFWSRARTARQQMPRLAQRPGLRSCRLISDAASISQEAVVESVGNVSTTLRS